MNLVINTVISTLMFVVVLAGGVAALVSTTPTQPDTNTSDTNAVEAVFPTPTDDEVSATVEPSDTIEVQGIRVHKSIAAAVDALLTAARTDGVVLSGWGYRSHTKQIKLRIAHCGGNNTYAIYQRPSSQCTPPTATPGRSQHEKGLAIDFANCPHASACFRWLSENAATYGLFNLPSESWHWSTTGR